MQEDRFWEIIHASFRQGPSDREEQLEHFERALSSMPRSEIIELQHALNRVMARAFHWDLLAAACFIGCGQSEDGFQDFRAWMVSLGRERFEQILADANELTRQPYEDSPAEEWGLEELHMLVSELGGEEDDPEWPYLRDPRRPQGQPVELSRDVLRERYPQLWQAFGDRYMLVK